MPGGVLKSRLCARHFGRAPKPKNELFSPTPYEGTVAVLLVWAWVHGFVVGFVDAKAGVEAPTTTTAKAARGCCTDDGCSGFSKDPAAAHTALPASKGRYHVELGEAKWRVGEGLEPTGPPEPKASRAHGLPAPESLEPTADACRCAPG